MAGNAALEMIRKYESGNDVRQIVSCSEGGRALRLLKRREETANRAEKEREMIENETKKAKVMSIDAKFAGSHADDLEEEFKKQTVGLMSVEEFTSRRKAIDELIAERANKKGDKELKLKRKINKKKLSFDDPDLDQDDSEDDDKSGSEDEDDEEALALKPVKLRKSFGKDPSVNTGFLYDKQREEELMKKKKELIDEYKRDQESARKEKLDVTYSYWDGTGHRRNCAIEKGFTIGQFLGKCKLELEKNDFPELRTLAVDSLMYVKEDLIISHNVTFYELIKDKARGKTGPLFDFGVVEELKAADIRLQSGDSHAGKIVDKKWYERNKHIFPACRWEQYSREKTFDNYNAAIDEVTKPLISTLKG